MPNNTVETRIPTLVEIEETVTNVLHTFEAIENHEYEVEKRRGELQGRLKTDLFALRRMIEAQRVRLDEVNQSFGD